LVSFFFLCHVNIQKSIDDPELNDLLIPGNSVNLTGGINGIILYRLNNDEFLAWERTCPYVPTDNCKISIDESNVFCECPCCESKYNIMDGMAYDGPSRYSLKSYQTYFDGLNIRIYN
jgi:nitrite reductase/ring-hydroxylating ferredoxin subunit